LETIKEIWGGGRWILKLITPEGRMEETMGEMDTEVDNTGDYIYDYI